MLRLHRGVPARGEGAAAAGVVYRFADVVAKLTEFWTAYLVVSIPAAIVCYFLWVLFDPKKVHREDIRQSLNRQ